MFASSSQISFPCRNCQFCQYSARSRLSRILLKRKASGRVQQLVLLTPHSESPLGILAAYASAEGYTDKSKIPQPFHGYLYRIITKQGEQVQEGARDYIVDGNMTGGFAILAYPAQYSVSGVMSFLINQEGTIFEKDFGDKTANVANVITEFNADGTWAPVGSLAQN